MNNIIRISLVAAIVMIASFGVAQNYPATPKPFKFTNDFANLLTASEEKN